MICVALFKADHVDFNFFESIGREFNQGIDNGPVIYDSFNFGRVLFYAQDGENGFEIIYEVFFTQ
jgi:hypothetical protein